MALPSPIKELMKRVSELEARIEKLEGKLEPKRKPGRPRKVDA